MTNQEKIKSLRQYRYNLQEIARLTEEIERWQSQAESVTASTGGTPGGSGDDRIQRAVESIDRLRDRLALELARRVELRDYLEDTIGGIEDRRLRLLMQYRYIDGWTWEKIAVEMHLDYRWVRRLHGRALEKLTLENPY